MLLPSKPKAVEYHESTKVWEDVEKEYVQERNRWSKTKA